MQLSFPKGSVGETLQKMSGVWLDKCQAYALAGEPLREDLQSGTPGPCPFENLVYCDFDGETYRQTNVTIKGRAFHYRSFQGALFKGVLHFAKLGPEDPDHIGVSGGPGVLFFAPKMITPAWHRYSEPDCIRLLNEKQRTRTTLLYRNAEACRTLTAMGERISFDPKKRVSLDPRGLHGPVHQERKPTMVFSEEKK